MINGKASLLGKTERFAERLRDLGYDWLFSIREAGRKKFIGFKHEVFRCRTGPVPGRTKNLEVSIAVQPGGESGDSRHVYKGLRRCASAMVCPVCGASLRYLRGREIQQIGRKMLGAGYSYVFLTLTARHDFQTSLFQFVKNFQAATRLLKTYKVWRNLGKSGMFSIRSIEVTDDNPDWSGPRSGFHFHSHTILFLDRPPMNEQEAKKLEADLASAWRHALSCVGMDVSLDRGVILELPKTRRGVVVDQAELEGLVGYLVKGAAFEMTGDLSKAGRGDLGRRVSVWTLLGMAAARDDPELWARWQTYALAMRGLSFLQVSHGLREFCGLGRDLTDKELLDGMGGEVVRTLLYHELRAVVDQGGQGKLLRLADEEGLPGIERGIRAALSGCDILTGEPLGKRRRC